MEQYEISAELVNEAIQWIVVGQSFPPKRDKGDLVLLLDKLRNLKQAKAEAVEQCDEE